MFAYDTKPIEYISLDLDLIVGLGLPLVLSGVAFV